MIKSKTKSNTDIEDTPKGKTEKESIPKEPLIIEPLYDGKDYPRMEVFVDTMNCTVGVRLNVDEKLKHEGYGSVTKRSILQLVDQKMFHEKLIAKRGDDFEATLKGYMKIVKQHNSQIMRLAGALEENDELTR